MKDASFTNADGDYLIVPQQGEHVRQGLGLYLHVWVCIIVV